MLKISLFILLAYIFGQYLYTSYYIRQSKLLIKNPYTQSIHIGSGPKLKILIAGDSLGAGIGATSFDTSLAGRLAGELAKTSTVELQNFSNSGAKMAQLQDVPIPEDHQDIILLTISSNDLVHTTDQKAFALSTKKVLQKFSPHAEKVIIIGPGNIASSDLIPLVARPYYHWIRPKYVGILQQESSRLPNVTYINPVDQPDSFTKNYAKNTTSTDHFHLNDEGYRWWADLVIDAIKNPPNTVD